MCLYTKQKEILVATHDIVCLKYLGKNVLGFYTPYQFAVVELDKELKAYENIIESKFDSHDIFDEPIFTIGSGVIHAKLTTEDNITEYCMKAIIPKGTKYYLSIFGDEIVARKMIITSEEIKEDKNKIIDKEFLKDITNIAPNENGIYVGDYVLQDGTYVRPTNLNSAPIGQVVGFHEHKPLIAAIDTFQASWHIRSRKMNRSVGNKDTLNMFNGKEVTKQIMREKDKDDFIAFTSCVNYHEDSKEQWYLPAFGEMAVMLNNVLYINAARRLTGVGTIIPQETCFWTCSECDYDSAYSWCCYVNNGGVKRDWRFKGGRRKVVPFLVPFNTQETTKTNSLVKKMKAKLKNII